MDQPSTFVYSVLKSAWGIRVSVTANVTPLVEGVDANMRVSGNIWISQALDGRLLGDAEMCMLVHGLRLVAREIEAKNANDSIVIVLTDLHFVESDFQLEGLAAAICGWAAAHFNFAPREFDVSFDGMLNRYIFDWASAESK
ncbi:hypothetical protein R8Z50_11425 [Longispora sp. K20-0274]|uniref:hypothetical protein n=1 Tax=Longispora sp. K20-0274 TaxID=3088255 RepID=UPI00399A5A61